MISTSPLETAAIERARAAPMLEQVERWCAINSGTGNLTGLARMAGELAGAFAILPGALRLVEPEPVELVRADGTVAAADHGRHLHLVVRPEAPVQLLFTGHMDTVYGPDHPFQTGRWLEGRLNAPGAADMKGGLALLLAALTAVEASPAARRFGYAVVINADEESGSLSSAALIAAAARGKTAAFTYEPTTLPDGTLAGARSGSGNFALVVRGKAAHAGRNPEQGRNALVAAAMLAVRLAEAGVPGLSVNPARIDGGGPNNIVPDLAILRVNFRPADPAMATRAQQLLERAVAEVAAAQQVRIAVQGGFNRPPKPLDPATGRLLTLVQTAGADLGLTIGWQPTGGVCDGNNIAALGVPVVDTMGARGGAIHSSEEYLLPESLAERAALSALAILRLIGQ